MKRGACVMLCAALALASCRLFGDDGEMSFSEASDRGQVLLDATPVTPTRMRVRVARLLGSNGRIHIVIPAGTLIASRQGGVQRMMTAKTVRIAMDRFQAEATIQIEVYCIDQFVRQPEPGMELELVDVRRLPAGAGGTRELNRTADLSDCLQSSEESLAGRQLAIWAVEGDFLDLEPSGARARLEDRYRRLNREQAEDLLRSRFRDEMIARFPGVSWDRIDRVLDRIVAERVDATASRLARRMADRDLRGFRSSAVVTALTRCGIATANRRLFA